MVDEIKSASIENEKTRWNFCWSLGSWSDFEFIVWLFDWSWKKGIQTFLERFYSP